MYSGISVFFLVVYLICINNGINLSKSISKIQKGGFEGGEFINKLKNNPGKTAGATLGLIFIVGLIVYFSMGKDTPTPTPTPEPTTDTPTPPAPEPATATSPGKCSNNPCKNGANCIDIDENNYSCVCPPGYSGPTCETSSNTAGVDITVVDTTFESRGRRGRRGRRGGGGGGGGNGNSDRFNCIDNQCVKASEGIFSSSRSCRASCSGSSPPPPGPAPVDCVVSEWGDWSECTETCGGGTQKKTRTITVEPKGNGASCPTPLEQTEDCNTEPCKYWECQTRYSGSCTKTSSVDNNYADQNACEQSLVCAKQGPDPVSCSNIRNNGFYNTKSHTICRDGAKKDKCNISSGFGTNGDPQSLNLIYVKSKIPTAQMNIKKNTNLENGDKTIVISAAITDKQINTYVNDIIAGMDPPLKNYSYTITKDGDTTKIQIFTENCIYGSSCESGTYNEYNNSCIDKMEGFSVGNQMTIIPDNRLYGDGSITDGNYGIKSINCSETDCVIFNTTLTTQDGSSYLLPESKKDKNVGWTCHTSFSDVSDVNDDKYCLPNISYKKIGDSGIAYCEKNGILDMKHLNVTKVNSSNVTELGLGNNIWDNTKCPWIGYDLFSHDKNVAKNGQFTYSPVPDNDESEGYWCFTDSVPVP